MTGSKHPTPDRIDTQALEDLLKALFSEDLTVLVEHKWMDAPASYHQVAHSDELQDLFDEAFADFDTPTLPQE